MESMTKLSLSYKIMCVGCFILATRQWKGTENWYWRSGVIAVTVPKLWLKNLWNWFAEEFGKFWRHLLGFP